MANTLTQVQLSGSNSPTFIIKSGDAYFVTQSVANYDPKLATTEAQRADIASVAELFANAQKSGGSRDAVELPPQNNVMSFQHVSSDD